MSETKTKERPELSFDGFGINGPDEYRTRLCTFNHMDYSEEDCQKYGKLFAASPDLLEAVKSCLHWMEFTIENGGGVGLNWGGPIHKARTAIARAEGRQLER